MGELPPERMREEDEMPCRACDGDGYEDLVDPETGGVIGPRPCLKCDGTGIIPVRGMLPDGMEWL